MKLPQIWPERINLQRAEKLHAQSVRITSGIKRARALP
jgi:hypothetical protein